MNTNPDVTRFVELSKATTPPNTLTKVGEEGDSYKFTKVSRGHHACESGPTIYIISEIDDKIGCSCGDMTYRCHGTDVCKHITQFLKLDVPPRVPAPGELIQKLMIMGWVGGKDDLHPAQQSGPASVSSNPGAPHSPEPTVVHYECPKCGETVDTESDKLQQWKLNHLDVCAGKKAPEARPPVPPVHDAPPVPPVHDAPAVAPLSEAYSSCEIAAPAAPPVPLSPDTVPTNLASALCNMQKIDLLAVTDSANPFHNAKYADLASVWAAIRKPLTDNGLAVIQTTEQYPEGVTVVTTLVHISGETFSSRLSCEVPKSKPDKNGQTKPNIQGLGSTITYLRRYSLAAMVGVAPIDDDGEAAMNR